MEANEVKNTLLGLHKVAKELNLDFTNIKVAIEYTQRIGGVSNEIMDNIIHPIYMPEGTYYAARVRDGEVVALQKEKGGEWIDYVKN